MTKRNQSKILQIGDQEVGQMFLLFLSAPLRCCVSFYMEEVRA